MDDTMQGRILLVEDDMAQANALMYFLEQDDYLLFHAHNLSDARTILDEQPIDLVLLDLYLPDGFGTEILVELPQRFERPPKTIVLTSHNDPQTSAWTIKRNAYDYFQKPVPQDVVRQKVAEALSDIRMEKRIAEGDTSDGFIVGKSQKMQSALDKARKLATTTIPVLVTGETGVGKEHFAHLIHDASPRAKKGEFVVADCTVIPAHLIENELFGHSKGAYTDAGAAAKGLVAQAENGTLFLDEIHQLPRSAQVKLLRLIAQGTYRPLGSATEQKANVRFVFATNVDLAAEVAADRFANDLYFRIKGASLAIPPLRERKMDLDEFIAEFINRFNRKHGLSVKGLKPDVRMLFHDYSWPGNVRELAQAIELAVILCEEDYIGIDNCPSELQNLAIQKSRPRSLFDRLAQPVRPLDLQQEMDRLAESMLRAALNRSQGNVSQAAKELGISRDQIRYMMKKFDLGADDFRSDFDVAAD